MVFALSGCEKGRDQFFAILIERMVIGGGDVIGFKLVVLFSDFGELFCDCKADGVKLTKERFVGEQCALAALG